MTREVSFNDYVSWSDGIEISTVRTVAPTDLPIEPSFVSQYVLRVMNDDADVSWIERTIKAVTQHAEHVTQRALMPQTWQQVMSGFPCSGLIRLERPPLIAVSSVAYYDSDNALQELAGSPSQIDVIASGAYAKAIIRPVDGTTFPETYCRPDAVTVTFTAGFQDDTDPELELINQGIALMVGELYKLRSMSVQGATTPSVLQPERFWRRVW